MRKTFAIEQGTTRVTLLIGPLALKFGRGRSGRECNLREWQRWKAASPKRRDMLCPTWAVLLWGAIAIQPRAAPMSEAEAQHRRDNSGFPEWDYEPGESHGDPTESKA